MALISCTECGNQVSSEAKTCPKCGAKVVKQKQPVSKILKWSLGILVGGAVILTAIQPHDNSAPIAAAAPAPVVKTPEQIAAGKKRDEQLQMAGAGAQNLKRASKDPKAFQLASLIVKTNGTACYEYRAKNGLGIEMPGEAVMTTAGKMLVHEQSPDAFVKAWNKSCTQEGGDDITDLVKKLGII